MLTLIIKLDAKKTKHNKNNNFKLKKGIEFMKAVNFGQNASENWSRLSFCCQDYNLILFLLL